MYNLLRFLFIILFFVPIVIFFGQELHFSDISFVFISFTTFLPFPLIALIFAQNFQLLFLKPSLSSFPNFSCLLFDSLYCFSGLFIIRAPHSSIYLQFLIANFHTSALVSLYSCRISYTFLNCFFFISQFCININAISF